MRISMKNTINKITFLLLSPFIFKHICAQEVGSGFSYQGQLLDSGVPANEKYDIIFRAYNQETGGLDIAEESFTDIQVDNGLFNISELDLGDAVFMGNEVWLELSVSKANEGNFITLSPRQRISAAPYAVQAEFLAANGADSNDILQFDGSNWVPQELTDIVQWSSDSTDPDSIHYNGSGQVGIGTNFPNAKLTVRADSNNEALRVSLGQNIKLRVNSNGGLSVGNFTEPPTDGLFVEGSVKQPVTSDGMMKYMVHANCSGTTSSIVKSYNGVNSGSVDIVGSSDGNCGISFPFDLSQRFWQVSAVDVFDGENKTVTCALNTGDSSVMFCNLTRGSNGARRNGPIMLLIY